MIAYMSGSLFPSTTPDKTVEIFQSNFQFRAMVPSCPKKTNSPPSPPLKGGNSLLICDSKHFCQGECNRYSCNVSQQVLPEVVAQ